MFESFILAGGKSSRMGRNKAFLKLAGKTLLEHAISTLNETQTNGISVLVGNQQNEFIDVGGIRLIPDQYENRGSLGGIQTALANCQSKFAFIVGCDFPFISANLVDFLLTAIKERKASCVLPIQPDGKKQPLCAIYNVEECEAKVTKLVRGTQKLPSTTEVLKGLNGECLEHKEIEMLKNSRTFFFNVNTPEDFDEAENIFGSR